MRQTRCPLRRHPVGLLAAALTPALTGMPDASKALAS